MIGVLIETNDRIIAAIENYDLVRPACLENVAETKCLC